MYSQRTAILKFFKLHWVGLVTATLIGIVMLLPQIWFRSDPFNNFRGILITETDNDYFYNSRISAAYDGSFFLSEVSLEGVRAKIFTNPPLGEVIEAGIAKILGVDTRQMIFVGIFLFHFLLSLVFYFLFFQLTGWRYPAALATLAIILASNLLLNPGELSAIFSGGNEISVNNYNRPIHPQISSLVFYLWLLVIVFWYQKSRLWFWMILGGILYGALFYIYPFSWILASVVLGLLSMFFLFQKETAVVKMLISSAAIGLLISSGYWVNYYNFFQHPLFEEMQKRFVVLHSRVPIWSNLLFIDSILLFFFWWKQRNKQFWFLAILVASLWVVINQQVITGFRLFPGHWHWYYVTPVTMIILVLSGYKLLRQWQFRFGRLIIMLVLFFVLLADGIIVQRIYYRQNIERYRDRQEYMPVYQWFEQNISPGHVVLADADFSQLLPVYTSQFRYIYLPTDELYLVPIERLKHTFFVRIFFEGATSANISNYINQDTGALRELLFGYFRRYTHGCLSCYEEADLTQLRREYVDFYQSDLETELKKYRIDYLVQKSSKNGIIDLRNLSFLDTKASVNGYNIYQIK